jgi:hypothetical protein
MIKKACSALLWVAASLTLLAACATLHGGLDLPDRHPEELPAGERPTCTECHDPSGESLNYEQFNHTAIFADTHRQQAYQNERVCSLCHQTSFCNDCHATRVELKPSIKNQTETYRRMPHRGDYLSRHRIDGRVDPTSCFRCHGNPKNAQTCIPCHG